MTLHKIINFFIAAVWMANGLFCKVLNLVPRHQEIVQRILKIDRHTARRLTIIIGFSEIIMSAWVLSGRWTIINAVAQILVIATMNTLEFFLAPDLLLWGKLNAFFALLFILLIIYNEFGLIKP